MLACNCSHIVTRFTIQPAETAVLFNQGEFKTLLALWLLCGFRGALTNTSHVHLVQGLTKTTPTFQTEIAFSFFSAHVSTL